MPTDPHHTPTIIQPSTSQPQKKQRLRKSKRKDTKIPQSSGSTKNVADEAVNEEMDDNLERAATSATSLDAEQDRDASLGDQEDASKQGRKIDDIDKDAEITLVDETQGRYGDDIMFDVSDLAGEEVFMAEQGCSEERGSRKALKSAKDGRRQRVSKSLRMLGNSSGCMEMIWESQIVFTFGKMLKNFDREDLEVLWRTVKAKFKKTEPVYYMDDFLLLNLKTMFKHHVEDNVWKKQQGLAKVLNWKLYDSYGVYCVTMQSMLLYLLVEKMDLSLLDLRQDKLKAAMYLSEVFGSILLASNEAFNEET
ncbi:hypothetical protein Tco_1351709 [Tanacetum coccineum]